MFIRKQKDDLKEYRQRETVLLSKPAEVKRLSDLLMLELTVSCINFITHSVNN